MHHQGRLVALAAELDGGQVAVAALCPGYVETDMVMAIRQDVRDQIVAGIPMGRLAKPQEIAAAVAFLASDEARYVTSIEMPVDLGGILK